MNKITIFNFKTSEQDRLKFVRFLAENIDSIGLKQAKMYQDQMLNGIPISFDFDDDKLDQLISSLKELDLNFEIK